MKILFINFLRLGDLLMMAPVINAYRKKFPDGEFHHLCFKEFEISSTVLAQIDRWHFLSRKEVQASASDSGQGLLAGIDIMKACFDRLEKQGFDVIVNLSHTHFSSLAMSQISAKAKEGVFFEGDRLHFSSPVFKELNQTEETTRHHYLDWYREGFDLSEEPTNWEFSKQSKPSSDEDGRRLYLFQTLSSDHKKSWSLENWSQLIQTLKRKDPLARMKILCAPFEKDDIYLLAKQTGIEVLAVDLKDALTWIKRANYLITVDTSVKHLANDSSCKVIELCLGSSDFKKQAIYKSGAVILASRVSCYPCAHQEACFQPKRICSSGISVEDVVQGIHFFEGEKTPQFKCTALLTTTKNSWSYKNLNLQGGPKIEKPTDCEEALPSY